MEQEFMRKAIIKEEIDPGTFKVVDIENKEELEMTLRGKARMNYINISIGDEVCVVVSSANPKKGRFIHEKYWLMGNRGK